MFTEEGAYYITSEDEREEKERKEFSPSEKFIIGCKALAGVSVTEMSKESRMSREYIPAKRKS